MTSHFARLMLDACNDGTMVVDPTSLTIVAANQTIGQLLLCDPETLAGKRITEIEISLPDVFYWEAAAAGQFSAVHQAETQYPRADGVLIDIERSIQPVRDDDGKEWLVIACHNIAQRKAAEHELAAAMAEIRATLEATADGVLLTSPGGHIRNFNHKFARMWNLPETLLQAQDEQLISQFMVSHMTDPEAFRARLEEILANPSESSYDTLYLADGRIFDCTSKPQQIRHQIAGRVFSFSDITQRVRAEEALVVALDQAEQASRAKSSFLSQMSHELKTPLNAILGFTQLMLPEATQNNKTFLQHIEKAGWHLLDLINDVLDMAKIEADAVTLELVPVELVSLIRDCLWLMEAIAQNQGIALQSSIDTKSGWARADAKRLRQALLNLISNAIKYNRPNGKVTLTLTMDTPGIWSIGVHDTGIGILAEDQSKLFLPFSRLGSLRDRVEGTGIGLALTRQLIERMYGKLSLHSEPEVGSSFWISLPETSPDELAPRPSASVSDRT